MNITCIIIYLQFELFIYNLELFIYNLEFQVEIGGGSIRIHSSSLQRFVFEKCLQLTVCTIAKTVILMSILNDEFL